MLDVQPRNKQLDCVIQPSGILHKQHVCAHVCVSRSAAICALQAHSLHPGNSILLSCQIKPGEPGTTVVMSVGGMRSVPPHN